MVIRRFGVLSVAKIAGAIYALLGLIAGAIFSMIAVFGGFASAAAQDPNAALASTFIGLGSVVIFPILYGCLGFIGGALSSAFYNLLAGLVGGIELEILEKRPAAMAPVGVQAPAPDPGFPG